MNGSDDGLRAWLEQLASQRFDALAISGDISEAPHLQKHLALFSRTREMLSVLDTL